MTKLEKIELAFENSLENIDGKYVFGYDFDMDKWEFHDPFELFAYELTRYGLTLDDMEVDIDGDPWFTIDGDTYSCSRDIIMVEDSDEAIALYGTECELQGVYYYRYKWLEEYK